jgi:hypothetical protein
MITGPGYGGVEGDGGGVDDHMLVVSGGGFSPLLHIAVLAF